MTDKDKAPPKAPSEKDDSPQNKHGVGTTQTTPKEQDETRLSATDPGHKDRK